MESDHHMCVHVFACSITHIPRGNVNHRLIISHTCPRSPGLVYSKIPLNQSVFKVSHLFIMVTPLGPNCTDHAQIYTYLFEVATYLQWAENAAPR